MSCFAHKSGWVSIRWKSRVRDQWNSTKSALLAEVASFVDLLGPARQAVLLAPAFNEPQWLGELRQYAVDHTSNRAPEERFVREAGYSVDRNYAGHLRGAAVYVGLIPAGQFLLLPRDALQELRLLRYNNGYLKVTAESSQETPAFCSLQLAFTFDVIVREGPCWRIQYRKIEQSNP